MNDFAEQDTDGGRGYFLSASERKLAASLERALALPYLTWRDPGPVRRVMTEEGGSFKYRPDFLIRNEDTGRTLAVELQVQRGLSRPNLMMYKMLSESYRKTGEEFLVLIDGKEEGLPARWLRNDNVRTAWIGGESQSRESAIREAVLAAL